MTETDFLDLMNKGFLIYQEEDGWILKKIPTPADLRASITSEVCIDTSRVKHSNFEAAFDHAMFLASEDDERPIPWEAFIRFDRGLGPESKRIEDIFAASQSDAQNKANQIGSDKYDDHFIEAIIRPAI